MLQYGLYLLSRHTGKPLQELIDSRPTLDILEKCLHGHTRTLEEPRAAHLTGQALNRRTLTPIKHVVEDTRAG